MGEKLRPVEAEFLVAMLHDKELQQSTTGQMIIDKLKGIAKEKGSGWKEVKLKDEANLKVVTG